MRSGNQPDRTEKQPAPRASRWKPPVIIKDPAVYKVNRNCLAHVDSEVAMSTGCRFNTDEAVGAILCSNANIPTAAILKITTNRGETLAHNPTAQADYIRRQVAYNEQWTKHLIDQAIHQIEPKKQPAPRASRWKPPVIIKDPAVYKVNRNCLSRM